MAKTAQEIKDKALKFVLNAYKIYSNRAEAENKWILWDKIYNCIPDKKNYDGVANLFPPATRKAVRTLLNFCDTNLWEQSPSFKLKGVGGKGDNERAEINTRILELQMEKINFRRKMRDFLEKQIKFGFAIAKVPYVQKKKYFIKNKQKPNFLEMIKNFLMGNVLDKETISTYDNIDFIPLSPFNVFWDYSKNWYEQEAIIEKMTQVSESDLRLLEKTSSEHYFGIKKALDEMEISGGGDSEDNKNKLDVMPHTQDITGLSGSFNIHKKTHELLECWCSFDIDDDGIDEECVIVILDRKEVIRLELNPYDIQEKPYVFDKWEDIEEAESLGAGVVQLAERSRMALNDFTNQLMDNITMILNNMWIYDELSGITADQLKSRPRGLIKSNNGVDAVKPLRPPDNTSAALRGVQMSKDDIAQISGATSNMQGLPARYDTTATEARQMGDGSQRDVFVKLRSIEDNVIKQFLRRAYSYNIQYLDTETVKKIIGIDAFKAYLVNSGKDITSDKYSGVSDILLGDYDFIPLGITQIENKIVKGQQAMNLFNIALKSPNGIWNIKGIAASVCKYVGDGDTSLLADNIDNTLLSPQDENTLMGQGEKPSAKMIENHLQHIQIHGLAQLPPAFEPIRQEHIKQHEQMLNIQQQQQRQALQQQFMAQQAAAMAQMQKQGLPNQEQPNFAPKGITPAQAGQVPNMVNPPVSLGGTGGQI
ncbi:MAG: hypothetical protein LBT79_07435 [Elusimicrobiota bacterium]|jgi:hypothetical protein|nr:hypothetical protein [Elusimicrobiota bacterium]